MIHPPANKYRNQTAVRTPDTKANVIDGIVMIDMVQGVNVCGSCDGAFKVMLWHQKLSKANPRALKQV